MDDELKSFTNIILGVITSRYVDDVTFLTQCSEY